jgi:hypothetical protein
MKNTDVINLGRFRFGLFLGLLRSQFINWRENIRKEIQFFLLCTLLFQMFLIKQLINQLPANAWNLMLNNIFEPIVSICLVVVSMMGFMFVACSIMADKIKKSLVG